MRSYKIVRISALICALFFLGVPGLVSAQDVSVAPKIVSIIPTPDGIGARFKVKVRINDLAEADFFVDTGASNIALSYKTALALGLQNQQPMGWGMAMTASGATMSPIYMLSQVTIGDITVHNVTAGVLPPGVDMNLLGNEFLFKLRRFEYKDGVLTLEQ